MLNNAATIENISTFRERRLLQPIHMGEGIDAMYKQNLNIMNNALGVKSYWLCYKPEIVAVCNNFSVIEFITAEFANPTRNLLQAEMVPINTIAKYKHPLHPKVIFEIVQPAVDTTRHPLQKKISAKAPSFWGAHDNRVWCKFIPLACLLMDKRIPNFEIIWKSLSSENRLKLLDNLSTDLQNAANGPVLWAVNPYFMDYYFRCLEEAVKIPIISDRLKRFDSLGTKIAKLSKDTAILHNKQKELVELDEVNTSSDDDSFSFDDEDNDTNAEDEEPQF